MDDDETNIKMKMKTTSSSSSKKRKKMKKQEKKLNHVFDAIDELESEDIKAASKRQKITNSNIQRAHAAQSQTKIYNHLVECRILFQRAILNSTSSSSTTTTTTTSIKNDDEDGQEGTDNNNTRKQKLTDQCDSLIQKLLQARNQLVKHSTLNGNSMNDDDDEKYKKLFSASYRDDDNEDDEEEEENDDNTKSNKLDDILDKEYNDCRENWKQVLNRRHKDLKLHSGITAKSQFRVVDSSFWHQVETTVEYEQMRQGNSSSNSSNNNNSNNNVFDDSKVYQQLLKDFVASSAAAAASGKGGSNDRLAAAKKSSSSSTKKNDVDRRASKGRKIRYKEIPKLVNFTFPLSRPIAANSSALNQDEWFQSLFGGAASRNNPNKS